MRKVLKKCLSILLVMILFIPSNMLFVTERVEAAEIGITANDYEISYGVDSAWDGAFNAHINIKNMSDSTIEDWRLKFEMSQAITNIWNAKITSETDGMYILTNCGYNQDIKAGQSVSIGFTVCGDSDIAPTSFSIISEEAIVEEGYNAKFIVNNDWNEGFSGELVITNVGNIVIEDWTVEFDFERNIDNIWNGILIDCENNHYVVKNADYNQQILPGQSVNIGINGHSGNLPEESCQNIILRSYGFWDNSKNIDDTETSDSERDDVEENSDLILYSSRNEIDGNDTYQTVFFYVKSNSDKVYLHDITNDTNILMYDDGNFSYSGDDIAGDGVFSVKYNLYGDTSADLIYEFEANSEESTSNKISVKSYSPFTDDEMSDIEYVEDIVTQILNEFSSNNEEDALASYLTNGSDYADDYDKKYAELYDAYTLLKENGTITDFTYDSVQKQFTVYFPSGYTTCVSLMDYNDFYEGDDTDEFAFPEISRYYDGFTVKIVNCFEDTSFRTDFYEDLVDYFEALGVIVSYDDYVTVTDFKTELDGYNFVCLCGHGSTVANKPVFCLKDEVENYYKTRYYYSADIKAGRVIVFTTSSGSFYAVYPEVVTNAYGGGKLTNTYVFSESCEFMGASHYNYNNEFAKAFVDDAGAVCTIGFYNSVKAVYSRDLMVEYIIGLMDGETPQDAFDYAKDICGANDYEYREPSFFEWLFDHDAFDKMGPTATPYMYGNKDEKVYKTLQNGDFEKNVWFGDVTPYSWVSSGDVRLISKLGSIKSYGSQMTMITTGVGAQSGTNLGGTQGSSIKQKFTNFDTTKLVFSYDFISEEPMEYVGSSYDDKFIVRVRDSKGVLIYSNEFETVNKSNWYPIEGIDFDGGDSTTYHTLWKTGEIDISAYCNSLLEIEFIVCDVGDSTYDSAVLLDNIQLTN